MNSRMADFLPQEKLRTWEAERDISHPGVHRSPEACVRWNIPRCLAVTHARRMNARHLLHPVLMPVILPLILTSSPAGVAQAGPASGIEAPVFAAPPKEHHPETWFHFIGGNVAPRGITADLEAISGAGIRGVQLFHGQFGGPWPGVEPQIKCLSAPWDGAVRHVGAECKRLGLDLTMQNCPGWAMAGGPWITPENAMRQLVWSRSYPTSGGTEATLPKPNPSGEAWRDYRDIAVFAFPNPEGDTGTALIPASIRSNLPDLPWEKCLRGADGGKISLSPAGSPDLIDYFRTNREARPELPGREPNWIEVSFPEPVTLRTVELPAVQTFNHGWCYDPGVGVTVEAISDGKLTTVAAYTMPPGNWQESEPISLACKEHAAKTYRIAIHNRHAMDLSRLRLLTDARLSNWEAAAAFDLRGPIRDRHPDQTRSSWVDPARIIDLTDKMDAAGILRWQVPPGKWTVLRLGHVNAGRRNGPAPPEATGWECDKLSAVGAEAHFAGYIGRLTSKGGPLDDGLLKGMLLDSWECGRQTWTRDMETQFGRLRGYPLRHWLPALAGYIIANPEATELFLRDWRATINDLTVSNFFGRMAELGRARGLAVSYETAMGDVVPGDILEFYKHADVPMCEFWHPRGENYVGSFEFKPVKPCVSAARMYGKRRVAAEAFTSFELSWKEHPGMLKDIANMHLAEGVTHLVFHTFTHNPRTDSLPPGSSFGASIGTPFLRGQTWWRQMPEFTGYLARCQYMLEQGSPVSDILWYLGDEMDHKPRQNAPFPAGYRYDYCNTDVLLNRLAVKDGKWRTPEGLEYRALWIPDQPRLLPETVERLLELVKQGGVLIGDSPRGIATLSGAAPAQLRFTPLVRDLWGVDSDLGKGQVLARIPVADGLKRLGIRPDLEGDGVVWCHRRNDQRDWYFVAAPAALGFKGTLRFRATGQTSLWNPATGETKPAGAMRREGDTSLVALDLAPSESVFVVFDTLTSGQSNGITRIEHNGRVVMDLEAKPLRPEVISAFYGDLGDSNRNSNVTDLVRRDVAAGKRTIVGSNEWAGGDPAPKTVKRLHVELRMPDGEKRQLEAREGTRLALVADDPPAAPVCEVDGAGRLLAWEAGSYRITRANGATTVWEAPSPRAIPLDSRWTLSFPSGWGAPEMLPLPRLVSWPDLDLPPEARAFSGTATYRTEFEIAPPAKDARVLLDLGRVEVAATVRINGKSIGCRWSPPYRLDITRAVKPGTNRLEVDVTNTWFNRLSYDAGQPEERRKTWTISGPAKGGTPAPSGILGPVILRMGMMGTGG